MSFQLPNYSLQQPNKDCSLAVESLLLSKVRKFLPTLRRFKLQKEVSATDDLKQHLAAFCHVKTTVLDIIDDPVRYQPELIMKLTKE